MSRFTQPGASYSSVDPSIQGIQMPTSQFQFSETTQSLMDLVKDQPLPRVIKYDNKTSRHTLKSNLDMGQPLLAFMTRSVRKVSAHSLQFDSEQLDFVTVGNGILIPEDYPGWFAVMGHPNAVRNSHQRIPHYTTLSYVATSRCSHFLVGGKDSIRGVVAQQDESGTTHTVPYQVLPGTVLRSAGLYREKQLVIKEKKKKKKGQEMPTREFLKCFDEQEREIYMHIHQKGTFYIISKNDTPASLQVLQMTDILKRLSFPVVVKLIYGRVPTTPCAFTQVLLLTDSGMSHTMVASTMMCYRNINLEIPLGTDMTFFVAKQTPGMMASKEYISALENCKEKASSYIKDMKVVFGNSQLGHDEGTQKIAKADQHSTSVQAPTSNLRNGSHVAVQNPSLQRPDQVTGLILKEHPPKRPANAISGTSYLLHMSQCVTVNDDSFIVTDQQAQPSPTSVKSHGNKTSNMPDNVDISGSTKMAQVKTYEPPNHDDKNNKITFNQHQGCPPFCENNSGAQARLCGNCVTESIYDNASHVSHAVNSSSRSEPTPCKSANNFKSSTPISVSAMTNLDDSNVYWTSWDGNKKLSTIIIPSKSGRPSSPARIPMIDNDQFDYMPMLTPKVPPKPCSQNGRMTHSPTTYLSPSPSIPEPPPLPDRNNSYTSQISHCPCNSEPPPIPAREKKLQSCSYNHSSSGNDSDSLTSMSEDGWSITDWSMCEDNIYTNMDFFRLKRVDSEISENDRANVRSHQWQYPERNPSDYVTLQQMPNPHGRSIVAPPAHTLAFTSNVDNQRNDYLELLHEDYSKTGHRANFYDEANAAPSEHCYSLPDNEHVIHNHDSGYTDFHHTNQPVNAEDSNDTLNRGQHNDPPQLPQRSHPSLHRQPATTGQTVMKPIPSPPAFSQWNKDQLLMELRKAGMKRSIEQAFARLQLADIINLFSNEEDFDDVLATLLPKLGRIDLMVLAVSLRGMKLSS